MASGMIVEAEAEYAVIMEGTLADAARFVEVRTQWMAVEENVAESTRPTVPIFDGEPWR